MDLYVDSVNGSDETGDGSILTPWATLSWSAANAENGDTVHVAVGTYAEEGNYPVEWVPGVTVEGDSPTTSLVTTAAANQTAFTCAGALTIKNLGFTGFFLAIVCSGTSTAKTLLLQDIIIDSHKTAGKYDGRAISLQSGILSMTRVVVRAAEYGVVVDEILAGGTWTDCSFQTLDWTVCYSQPAWVPYLSGNLTVTRCVFDVEIPTYDLGVKAAFAFDVDYATAGVWVTLTDCTLRARITDSSGAAFAFACTQDQADSRIRFAGTATIEGVVTTGELAGPLNTFDFGSARLVVVGRGGKLDLHLAPANSVLNTGAVAVGLDLVGLDVGWNAANGQQIVAYGCLDDGQAPAGDDRGNNDTAVNWLLVPPSGSRGMTGAGR